MFDNKYYLDLITKSPLNYNGLFIYPPTLKEIRNTGIETYNNIMFPYTLTVECFDEYLNSECNLFENIILGNKDILRNVVYSLYILTKADTIKANNNSLLLEFKKENDIDQSFVINATNFDDICDIILKINSNKKIEIEKPPSNMSERQKDVWNKLQEGRKKEALKNEVHLYDILNVCEFGGNYHIAIENIETWSLWRIMNCYKSILNIKTYNDTLKICLVSGDGKSISGNNHWHSKLMIRE